MIKSLLMVVLPAFTLSACMGSITVLSVPEGALISSNNESIGIAPHRIELTPDISKAMLKAEGSCYEAPSFTARWASGAIASSPVTPLCDGLNGNYRIFIRRPVDAPGLNKDLQVEARREEAAARRREARAINNEANSEEGGPSLISIGGWQIY
ncbi:hypothetical protein [Polynucleobacter sp. MG-27-Goln-C1]|uniref:hypothetical protein n=1 Tax=Polynucleobacter sp. MG-27-Goln-C1 TaxID=1819726 RepID=UPI001C0E28A9|nr:hypothetical protein [Polynucleobacter sp. MG-27-Goln-C1]MBU3612940.1 hypothetical protein [Polynucleobacter sp. MG-27-Goln-C1]